MSWLGSKLKLWLALAGAGLVAGAVFALKLVTVGKTKEKVKRYEQNAKAQERGRDAVARGRDSGDTPADRLRRNDGRW